MGKTIAFGALVASVPALPTVCLELVSPGPRMMPLLILIFVALIVMTAALPLLLWKRTRAHAATIAGTAAFATMFLVAYVFAYDKARMSAFARLAARSENLVRAIGRYEQDNGAPPEALSALVPDYLDAVPSTGFGAYPKYQYMTVRSDAATKVHWYDLGSRRGKDFAGLWKYPDGPPGHAILALTTDHDDRVIRAAIDRARSITRENAFDTKAWIAGRDRMSMVGSLLDSVTLVGQPYAEVIELIGPADGVRTLRGHETWELKVPCSMGVLNWDAFVYRPTEIYPDYMYGGSTEAIAGWAYVHE